MDSSMTKKMTTRFARWTRTCLMLATCAFAFGAWAEDVAKIGETTYEDLHTALVDAGQGQTVELLRDVDLTGVTWEPVPKFYAVLDGKGHQIKNLNISADSGDYIGLFASMCSVGLDDALQYTAEVRNLTMTNVTVSAPDSMYVGVICGGGLRANDYNPRPVISNVTVVGTIQVIGYKYVGGIIGHTTYGNLADCHVDGLSPAQSYVGQASGKTDEGQIGGINGMTGEGNFRILDCTVRNLTLGGNERVGGISGRIHGTDVGNCLVSNVVVKCAEAGSRGALIGTTLKDGANLVFNPLATDCVLQDFTGASADYALIGTGAIALAVGTNVVATGGSLLSSAWGFTSGCFTLSATDADTALADLKTATAAGCAVVDNGDGTYTVQRVCNVKWTVTNGSCDKQEVSTGAEAPYTYVVTGACDSVISVVFSTETGYILSSVTSNGVEIVGNQKGAASYTYTSTIADGSDQTIAVTFIQPVCNAQAVGATYTGKDGSGNYLFTIAAGQTVTVYKNGVALVAGTDYTVDGTTVMVNAFTLTSDVSLVLVATTPRAAVGHKWYENPMGVFTYDRSLPRFGSTCGANWGLSENDAYFLDMGGWTDGSVTLYKLSDVESANVVEPLWTFSSSNSFVTAQSKDGQSNDIRGGAVCAKLGVALVGTYWDTKKMMVAPIAKFTEEAEGATLNAGNTWWITATDGDNNPVSTPYSFAFSHDGRYLYGVSEHFTGVNKYEIIDGLGSAGVKLKLVKNWVLGSNEAARNMVYAKIGAKEIVYAYAEDLTIYALDVTNESGSAQSTGVTSVKKYDQLAIAGKSTATPHLYFLRDFTGKTDADLEMLAIYDINEADLATLQKSASFSYADLSGFAQMASSHILTEPTGNSNNKSGCALVIPDDEKSLIFDCAFATEGGESYTVWERYVLQYTPPTVVDFSGNVGVASATTNSQSVGSSPYTVYTTMAAAERTITFTAESGKYLASVTTNGVAVEGITLGATSYALDTTKLAPGNNTVVVKFVDAFTPPTLAKGSVEYYSDAACGMEIAGGVAPGVAFYAKVTANDGYVAKLAVVDGVAATVDADGTFSGTMKGEGKVDVAFVKDTAWFLDPFVRNSWKDTELGSSITQSALVDETNGAILLGRGPGTEGGIAQYAIATITNAIGGGVAPVAAAYEENSSSSNDRKDYWSRSMACLPSQYAAFLSCNGADRSNSAQCTAVENRLRVQPFGGAWSTTDSGDTYVVAMTGLDADEHINLCPIAANGDATKFYGVDYDQGTKLYRFVVVADGTDATKVGSVAKDACWDIAIKSGLRGMACATFQGHDVIYMANDKKDAITVFDTSTGTTNTYTACAGEYYEMYITGVADGTPHLVACDSKSGSAAVKVWALDDKGQFLSTTPIATVSVYDKFAETPDGSTVRYDFAALADDSRAVLASQKSVNTEYKLQIAVVEKKPANLTVRAVVTHVDATKTTNDLAIAYGTTDAASAVNATEGTKFTAITADGTAVDAATLPAASYTFTPAADLDHHVLVTLAEEEPITVTFTTNGTASVQADSADVTSPYEIFSITPSAAKTLTFTPASEGEDPVVTYTLKSVTTNGAATAFTKGTTDPFAYTVTTNVALAVTYVKPYTVKWSVTGGTCDAPASPATVAGGSSNFVFTAESGKFLKSVTTNDHEVALGDLLGASLYTYVSADDNGTAYKVAVVFAPHWDVTTTLMGGSDWATVALDQSGKLFQNDTISGTITGVKEGYTAIVYVDGVKVTVANDGKFSGTAANSATVAVAFAKNDAWYLNPFVRNTFAVENDKCDYVQSAAYDATKDAVAFGLSSANYVMAQYTVSALTNAIGEAVEADAAVAVDAAGDVGAAGACVAALPHYGVFVSVNASGNLMVSPVGGTWGTPGDTDVTSYLATVQDKDGNNLSFTRIAANEAGTVLYGVDASEKLYKLDSITTDGGTPAKITLFKATTASVAGVAAGGAARGMVAQGHCVYVTPVNAGLTVVDFSGETPVKTTYATGDFAGIKSAGMAVTGGETPHLIMMPNSGANLLVFALGADGQPLSTTAFATVPRTLFANVPAEASTEARWGLLALADESRAVFAHHYEASEKHYAQYDVVEAQPDAYVVRARLTDKDNAVTTTDYAYDAANGVTFTAADHTVFTSITTNGVTVDATALPTNFTFKAADLNHHVLVTLTEQAAVTMTFDLQGHGTAIAPVTVLSGDVIAAPSQPSEAGYTFRGWFTEAGCENAYDFANTVTEDKTVYAKWTADLMVNGVDVVGASGGTGTQTWTVDGTIKLMGKGPYMLTGTNTASVLGFTVTTGTEAEPAEIILNDVTLTGAAGVAPITIAPNVHAIIYLKGTNTLVGGDNCAAINVVSNDSGVAHLTIADISDRPNGMSLTSVSLPTGINANMLVAQGGENGAGIGGNNDQSCGSVTMESGVVLALGGSYAAGIGGGNNGDGGAVEIVGGTVIATGVNGAKDVGAGVSGSVGTTVITGGSLSAASVDNPVDAAGNALRCVTLDLGTDSAGTNVTALTIRTCTKNGDGAIESSEVMTYGADDLFADSTGKLNLWLTNGTYTVAVATGGATEPTLTSVEVPESGTPSASPHTHTFTYAADDDADTITQSCAACGHAAVYALTVSADEVPYTGAAQTIGTIANGDGLWIADGDPGEPTLDHMSHTDAATTNDLASAPNASMSFTANATPYKVTKYFTIKPATVSFANDAFTAEQFEKGYDGGTNVMTSIDVAATALTGTFNSDDVKLSLASEGSWWFDAKGVGTGTRTVTAHFALTGDKAANYTLGAQTNWVVSGVTITPREISAVSGLVVSNKVYDGTTAAQLDTTATPTFTGYIEGDDLSVSVTSAAFVDATAGDNKAVTLVGAALAGADAGNYVASADLFNGSFSANITKKTVSVTADPMTVTYGSTEALTFTATTNALCTGDDWTTIGSVACSETSLSTVGTYTGAIVPSGYAITSGNGGDNYVIAYVNADFTVDAADLTGVSVTYTATQTYNGADQNLIAANVATAATAVNGQTVSFTYGADEASCDPDVTLLTVKDAENKTFTFKATAPNHNAFVGTFTAKTLPRAVAITSCSYTNYYTGAAQSWPVAVTNSGSAAAGEGWDFTNWAAPMGSPTAQTAYSNSYELVLWSGTKACNYAFTTNVGEIVIRAAAVKAKAKESDAWTYVGTIEAALELALAEPGEVGMMQLVADYTGNFALTNATTGAVVFDLNGYTLTAAGTDPVITYESAPGATVVVSNGTVAGMIASADALADGEGKLVLADVKTTGDFTGAATFEYLSGTNTFTSAFTGANVALKGGVFSYDQIDAAAEGYTVVRLNTTPATWEAVPAGDLKALIQRNGSAAWERYADLAFALTKVMAANNVAVFAVTNDAAMTLDLGGKALKTPITKLGTGTLTISNGTNDTTAAAFQGETGTIEVVDGVVVKSATIKSGAVTVLATGGLWASDPTDYCAAGYVGTFESDGWFHVTAKNDVAVTITTGGDTAHYKSFADALANAAGDAVLVLYNNLELDAPITCSSSYVYITGTETGNGGLPATTISRKAGYTGPLFEVSGGVVALTNVMFDAGGVGTAIAVSGQGVLFMEDGLVVSNAVCGIDATAAGYGYVRAEANADVQVWDNVTNVWTSFASLFVDAPFTGKVGVTEANGFLYFGMPNEGTYPDTAPGEGIFNDEDDPTDMKYWTGVRSFLGYNLLKFLTQPEAPANDLTLLGRTGAALTIEGTNGLEYAAVKADGSSTATNFVACTATGALVLDGLEPATTYAILERFSITDSTVLSETHAMTTRATTLRYNALAILKMFDTLATETENDVATSGVAKVEAFGLGYKVTLKQDIAHSVYLPEDVADLVVDLAGHGIVGAADVFPADKRNGVNIQAVSSPDPQYAANVTFVNSAATQAVIAGADGSKGVDGVDDGFGGKGKAPGNGIQVMPDVQHVTITLDGSILVTGGNGGDGGNAVSGDGGAAWQGGFGIVDYTSDASRAHDGLTLVVDNEAVTVVGGNGGNGGSSTYGNGGAGGDGAVAVDVKEAILSAGAFIGGAGGAGGTSGGDGKAAGNGGNGAASMSIYVALDQVTGGTFEGGDAGEGGQGQSGASSGTDGTRGRSGQPAAPEPVDVLRITGVSISIGVDAYQQYQVVKSSDGTVVVDWTADVANCVTNNVDSLTPDTTYVIYNRFAANTGRSEPVSFVASNVVTTTAWGPDQIKAAFQDKADVTMNGEVGTVVTLTGDIDGTVTLPTNYGDITLDLNGFSITGTAGEPAISLTGAAGYEEATYLAISNGTATASALTGGSGGDGAPNATTVGYDGGNGAPAIAGVAEVAFVENGGEINVTGGNGGKGSDTNGAKAGDGGAGGAAVALTDGALMLYNEDATFTGGDGGDGGDALAGLNGEGGGKGGDGGVAVSAGEGVIDDNAKGTFTGGNGGNGGNTRDSSVNAKGGNGGNGGDTGVEDIGTGGNGGNGGAGYGGATIEADNAYTGIGGKGGAGKTSGETGRNGNGSLGACPRTFRTEGANIIQDCSCDAHAHLAMASLTVHDSTYDGAVHENASFTMTDADEWLAPVPQISYVGDKVNVGVVTAVLSTVVGTTTYAVTNVYEILPAELEDVSVEQDGELVYDGTALTADVTASATAVGGKTVTFTYCDLEDGTYGADVPSFTDAGDHEVYFKATAANHEEETGSFTVTVKPAKLTDVSVAQNGALVYNGSALTPTVSASATAQASQATAFFYGVKPGEYGEQDAVPAVTLPGVYTNYYKVTAANHAAFESNFVVTVGNAALTGVSVAQDGTLTYTGAAQAASVTASATAVGGQKVSFTYCATVDGTYTAELPTFKDAADAGAPHVVYYKASALFHDVASGSFNVLIGKASLTVTANDKTITYGDAAANAGVKFSGLQGLDDESALDLTSLAYDYGTYTVGSNAGTYPITPSGVTAANYDVSYTAGTLTVEKTSLGGEVPVTQKNALTYNGLAQFPDLNIGTNKYLGVLTFKWGLEKGKYGAVDAKPALTNAGEYVVYYEVSAGANTTSAEGEMTVTIDKRTMELVAGTSTNYWNGLTFTDHNVITNGDGFVAGEGAVFTFPAEIVGDVEEGGKVANAFTYELTEKTLASNYEITTKAGEIVVLPGVVRASRDGGLSEWVGFGTLSNAYEYVKMGGLVQLVAPYACTNGLVGAAGSAEEVVVTEAGQTTTLDLNEFAMTGTLTPTGSGAFNIIGNGELELVTKASLEPVFDLHEGWKKNDVTGGYEIVRDADGKGARTTIAGEEKFYATLTDAIAALQGLYDANKLSGDVKIDLWTNEAVSADANWIVDYEWPINLTIDGNGYTVFDTNRTEGVLLNAGGNLTLKDVTLVGDRSTGLAEFYADATVLFKDVTVTGYGRAAKAAGEGSSLPLIANVGGANGVVLTLDNAVIEGNDVDCAIMAGYEPDAKYNGYYPITVRVKGATRVCGNGDKNVVLASADRLVLAGDFTGKVGVTPVAAYVGSKVGELGGAFAVATGVYAGAENFVKDADGEVYGMVAGTTISWTKDMAVAVTIGGVAGEVVIKTVAGVPTMDLTAYVTDAKHLTTDTQIVLSNLDGAYDDLSVAAPRGWTVTVVGTTTKTVTFAIDYGVVKAPALSTNEDGKPFVATEKGVTMGVDNAVPGFIYRLQQAADPAGPWETVAERRATGTKVNLPWEPETLPSESYFQTTVSDK